MRAERHIPVGEDQQAAAQQTTALQALAAQAVSAGDAPLTPEVVAKAKTCLLDYFSCAFEAADLQWSRQAADLAVPLERGATLVGRARKTTAEDAAFANAVAGHGLVREDMHAGSIAHLGVVVWPTLLALAETRALSGRALLRGAVVGYEIGGRLGRLLVTPEVAGLFRPTGLVGPLAATGAGAVALGLDEETTASAMALAANCCGGLNEWPRGGADDMYFHPGFVARNALRCLDLARLGAWGAPTILEGPGGLFRAYARMEMPGPVTLFPDARPEILNVFNKPVPACNFAQSPCQAALAAARGLAEDSEEVAAIEVESCDAAIAYPGCAATGPFRRALQAKMSIPFGVAAAVARGEIAEENYRRLDDPEIRRLVAATSLRAVPEFNAAFPERQGARVTLVLRDGRRLTEAFDDVVVADAELVRRRFAAAAAAVNGAPAAEMLGGAVAALESEDDAGRIARLSAQRGEKG